MDVFKLLHGFDKLIHGFLYMLLHEFVQIDTWTSLSYYMYVFDKVVRYICQSAPTYFSPFAKQNQAEA